MKKKLLLILSFFVITSVLASTAVLAKTVSIPSVNITGTINKDGSVLIVENRTLKFDGDYTFGFYELPKSDMGKISSFKVSEGNQDYTLETNASRSPGTYVITELDDKIRIDFFFNAINESRTFTFTYIIADGVKVYQDYGQFYWKLQGTGWGYQVDSFTATINWKNAIPMDSYYIWAHGPLWGNFTKTNETSSYLESNPVPANTFVEVRVMLPSSYFTANKLEGTIYDKALKEETVWADQANSIRNRAQNLVKMGHYLQILFILLALFLVWNYFRLYSKHGKEHKIANESIYYREPPSDLKPAIVGMLYNFQKYDEKYLQATMIDLIRRKHLQYDEIKGNFLTKDHQLTLLSNKEDKLEDFEDILLNKIIFEGKTQVTLKGLKKKFNLSNTKYYYLFNDFKSKIQKQAKKLGFFDDKSNSVSVAALWWGIFLIFIGGFAGLLIPTILLGNPTWFFMSLVPVGFLYAFGHSALKRRTEIGKQEYSKWKAFRLFMKDFSNLQAYGPKSLIIWERFLVYATVFGIASIILKALKIVAPTLNDMDKGTLLAPAMFTAGTIPTFTSLNSALSGISSMAGSIPRTASSSSSSGSGGGGGFSSGGGGGGGGGGSGGGFG
jgi:uncharacterized membrane protein